LSRKFETVDLRRIKTISLAKRKSLATTKGLAKVPTSAGADKFLDSLPGHLKAQDLKLLIRSIVSARKAGKPVIIMAGGHVIKVGLNPVIIDLMKHSLISGICLNGAGLIHDAEIAMVGHTSEDVAAGIGDGSFGMSAQTAELFASVTGLANKESIGLGQASGMILSDRSNRFRRHSLLAACHKYKLPAMIHMAVDTDIVCQHPDYDAAAAARASHHDFKILAHQISRGEGGGVFINIGSAVLLPEVFLKALTVSRNIYKRPRRIITANFDMINHYRPATNVVHRPTMGGGTGYNFVGHHEIMIPLLAWGLKAQLRRKKKPANKTA
jgi:hypothetical protein